MWIGARDGTKRHDEVAVVSILSFLYMERHSLLMMAFCRALQKYCNIATSYVETLDPFAGFRAALHACCIAKIPELTHHQISEERRMTTMNALVNNQPIQGASTASWFDAVRHALTGLGAAVTASRRYKALSALTDEQLAARGLDRTRVVEIVARSYLQDLARH